MNVVLKLSKMSRLSLYKLKKKPPSEIQAKPKAKINRFNGLTEEEVQQNSPPLPDYLKMDLDLVFVGINPSLTAAFRGRYYAGPGNHFYKLLHESGLVSRFVSFEEDNQLLEFGIGLTNIVDRATRSSADLSRAEIKKGSVTIARKMREYKPKVAVFNGRCIYDVFANKTAKSDFNFGLQPERIGETALWVVPSSSARCSNFPRMTDKLQFYLALKKYLSFVKGEISEVDPKEFYFTGRQKNASLFFNRGKLRDTGSFVGAEMSDESTAFVSNKFVIKEIISQDGIESFEENMKPNGEIENREGKASEGVDDINFKGGNEESKEDKTVRRTQKIDDSKANKGASGQLLVKSLNLPPRTRENPSDFVSLIKQRIEAKKRKAEDLEIP